MKRFAIFVFGLLLAFAGQTVMPGTASAAGLSVYYSPPAPNNFASGANIHKAYDTWRQAGTVCGAANAGNFPANANTALAGWSIGRLGPVYTLAANWHKRYDIDYILLFDPGNYSELVYNYCDAYYRPGQLYRDWLVVNPNARLVILSGALTAQGGHSGIQKAYFEQLKIQGGPRHHVTVCNYNLGHQDVFLRYRAWINRAPITTSTCPDGALGWHP